jgi:hypothetical protein
LRRAPRRRPGACAAGCRRGRALTLARGARARAQKALVARNEQLQRLVEQSGQRAAAPDGRSRTSPLVTPWPPSVHSAHTRLAQIIPFLDTVSDTSTSALPVRPLCQAAPCRFSAGAALWCRVRRCLTGVARAQARIDLREQSIMASASAAAAAEGPLAPGTASAPGGLPDIGEE